MSSSPAEFYLGQYITIDSLLKRKTKFTTPDGFGRYKRLKVWENTPLKKSKSAMVIGIRNLSNGNTDYDSDIGYMYNATEYFKALLVVSDLNSSPFFVELPKNTNL